MSKTLIHKGRLVDNATRARWLGVIRHGHSVSRLPASARAEALAARQRRLDREASRAAVDPLAARVSRTLIATDRASALHWDWRQYEDRWVGATCLALREAGRRRAEDQKAERLQAARDALRPVAGIIRSAVRQHYRLAQGSWAGGNTTVSVEPCSGLGESPSISSTTHKVWSSNGKWSGLDLSVIVTVSTDWDTTVQARELAVVEHRLTLEVSTLPQTSDIVRDGEEAYAATWAEQGRGMSIHTEHGILYRRRSRAGGPWLPWVHAQSLRSARTVYARQLSAVRQEIEEIQGVQS